MEQKGGGRVNSLFLSHHSSSPALRCQLSVLLFPGLWDSDWDLNHQPPNYSLQTKLCH